jgi:hypothetical protein
MHVKRYGNEGDHHYNLKKLISEFLSQHGYQVYPEGRFETVRPSRKRPDIVAYKLGVGTFLIEITHSRYKLIPDK